MQAQKEPGLMVNQNLLQMCLKFGASIYKIDMLQVHDEQLIAFKTTDTYKTFKTGKHEIQIWPCYI